MVTSNAVQPAPQTQKRRTTARRRTTSRRQTPTAISNQTQEVSAINEYVLFQNLIPSYAQSRHISQMDALSGTTLLTFMDWLSQRSERQGRNNQNASAGIEQPRTMTAGATS